jgi:hypothetical protein
VSFAHDGLGLDPVLVYRAERADTFVVRVCAFAHPPAADIKLVGGPTGVYRLSLTTAVPVRYAFPAGVRRGTKANVELVAWGAALDAAPKTVEVDATAAKPADEFLSVGDSTRVELSDGPEWTEPALRSPGPAMPLAAPAAVTGRIEQDAEEDVYPFTAKKDQRLALAVRAVATASPLDAVIRLEDASGKTLAEDDDRGGGSDAQLEWTAPADGVYRAVVADRYRAGGPDYVYRLSVRPAEIVGVTGTLDGDEYKVEPGKTATMKVTVARGSAAPGGLVAVATGLPPGVSSTAADVPEKGGEVTLTLTAAADAKPAAGPIRVVLLATDPARPSAWIAGCNLRKDGGQELIARMEAPWLTVPPAPAAAPPAEKKP